MLMGIFRFLSQLRKAEGGSAFISALIAIGVLALLAGGTLTLGSSATRSSTHWNNLTSAFYAAESGINEALYRLEMGEKPDTINSDPAIIGSSFSYTVTITYSDVNAIVMSKGKSGNSTRTIQTNIHINPKDGLFVEPTPTECPPPPNERPANCDALEITVDFHDTHSDNKLKVKENNPEVTIGPGILEYKEIKVCEECTLTIEGPATVYVKNDFKPNGELILDGTNGKVTLYFSGDVDFKSAVTVNGTAEIYAKKDVKFKEDSSLDPGNGTSFYVKGDFEVKEDVQVGSTDPNDAGLLTVYMDTASGGDVKLEEGSSFTGGIYAPSSEVKIKEDAQVTGAVVGKEIDLKDGAAVTWNESVTTDPAGGTGVVGGSWGEL